MVPSRRSRQRSSGATIAAKTNRMIEAIPYRSPWDGRFIR
jgi:hypothetical protein